MNNNEYKNCSVAFWGEPDIGLQFCEDKYQTPYIAEYYNSMSAISYMIVGFLLWLYKKREIGAWVFLLGIGTFLMHTTLRYYGQWCDELSILMIESIGLKKLKKIRYHNIYCPRMGNRHVIPELIMRLNMKENPLNLYGGKETRSFCYISDAILATYKIASEFNCRNEIIHVGNPMEEIQIIDLADKMINLMGLDIKVQSSSGLEGSVSRRCPDISKLQPLTNFEPLVDLYSGLQKTINWYLP